MSYVTARPAELSLANFAAQVPVMAGGNTPFAAAYARELRDIAIRAARRDPRSIQVQPGPSDLGHACHRRVIGKMSGQAFTNNVIDPWASIIGKAVHKWLADAFDHENSINGTARWLTERKVYPDPRWPGTADLYDGHYRLVGDHKIIGDTTMAKVRSAGGPPWYYQVQLMLYAQGYRNLGLPVERVVLAAWPRTKPTLDLMYCWERPYTPADDEIVRQVLAVTAWRKQQADLVLAGQRRIEDIQRTPGECITCPFFRPQARDGGPGCPGTPGPAAY